MFHSDQDNNQMNNHAMRRLLYRPALLAIVLLFIGLPLKAEVTQQPAAESAYQAGMQSFQHGHYEKALLSFQAALDNGLDRPALHYNLGVCHYRLEHYPEAATAFKKAATMPAMAPLAHYNLGLVAMRQRNYQQARQWFTLAGNETGDEKLRMLTEKALAEVEIFYPTAWLRYGSIGLGHDDNVTLSAETGAPPASGQEDGFSEFMALFTGPVAGGSRLQGWQAQANFYYLKYFDLTDFDTGLGNLGLSYRKPLAQSVLEGGGNYTYTLLDGQGYEQLPALYLSVVRHLSEDTSIKARYDLGYLDLLTEEADLLSGWRHRLLLEASHKWPRLRTTFGYILELNDRDDPDYSPTRHTLSGSADFTLTQSLILQAGFSYRTSTFELTSLPDRDEDKSTSRVRLVYNVRKAWEISGEYQYINNSSSDASYSYTRNLALISLARFF